jgi:hypothetical protein
MPKTRRTPEERLEDKKREIAELEKKIRMKSIETALKEGRLSEEDEAEFKKLKSELNSVKKSIKAARRHENTVLAGALEEFSGSLADRMAALVTESDG